MTQTQKPIDPVKALYARLKDRIPGKFPDFTTWSTQFGRRNRDGTFRCLTCSGSKCMVAPWEKPCPVEGYKMADRIRCDRCNGTSIESLKSIKVHYNQEKLRHTERKRNAKSIFIRFEHAFNKLNHDEQELLIQWKNRLDLF